MSRMLNVPVNFAVKSLHEEDDSLIIEGYANTTTVDRVGDIILEEAWSKGGLDNYLKNPIILAYHKHDRPIGKMENYGVNNRGLLISAKIFKAAGEIYSLIKEGVLQTFSVGFRTLDAEYDTATDLFIIKDLELMEISVVSIPANADSTFSVRKSFKTDEECTLFKSEFEKDTATVNAEEVSNDSSDNNEENITMADDNKIKAEMEAQIRADIAREDAEKQARTDAIKGEVTSQIKEVTSATVEVVGEQVEKLKTEIETRLADETKTFEETLGGLKNEIKEYAEQLTALSTSKMQFVDRGNAKELFTPEEKDFAVMVAKMSKKPVEETKWFQNMITKSDAAHQAGMTEDWEATFALRLWDDIREKLIIENMFTTFPMQSVTVNLPLNPEAGYGTWVTTAQFAAATSSGTARVHGITDTSITAHKLATKELLSYEEEDDSMIAMVPLIREAAIRRMAKSSDKALLIGNSGDSPGAGEGLYPFDGLAQIGIDDGRTQLIAGNLATPTKVTVADLQAMRRQMGVHGHSPDDVVYVVNHNVYFDLLDDPDFRTTDKVSNLATIVTGQIGRAAGSAVVVSAEFPAVLASNAAGIAVNMQNYIKGAYKGLTVERERSVEFQTNLLVVTRRFGMIELFPAHPTVVTLINPAT